MCILFLFLFNVCCIFFIYFRGILLYMFNSCFSTREYLWPHCNIWAINYGLILCTVGLAPARQGRLLLSYACSSPAASPSLADLHCQLRLCLDPTHHGRLDGQPPYACNCHARYPRPLLLFF